MSDFSENLNDKESDDDVFCPLNHINSVCNINKIGMKDPIVDYRKGWALLIEGLFRSLKGSNILLTSITSQYGQLDTEFFIAKGVRAAKVYYAVEVARKASRTKCMECGKPGSHRIVGQKVVVICLMCESIMESSSDTGTWLDRY